MLPVKGQCPKCKKDIQWTDVIRGVFARSGRMESGQVEDDELDESELDEDEEEDEEEAPKPARKNRGSDLVRLTGKSKGSPKSKATTSKGKKQTKKNETLVIPASDGDESEDILPSTPQPKKRGRPKKNADPRKTDELESLISPPLESKKRGRPKKSPEHSKPTHKKKPSKEAIPDSAGEERDVWIISSDDE
jgi:AT hook motif